MSHKNYEKIIELKLNNEGMIKCQTRPFTNVNQIELTFTVVKQNSLPLHKDKERGKGE